MVAKLKMWPVTLKDNIIRQNLSLDGSKVKEKRKIQVLVIVSVAILVFKDTLL